MLVPFLNSPSTVLLGVLAAFVFTCLAVQLGSRRLPRDMGREYAVQGQLSAGKPRGAGFLFILAFTAAALLFAPISLEMVLYLLMTFASMMTGFLDDCSSTPWDEYRKGLLDLAVSVLTIVTYINFNGTEVRFALLGKSWQVPVWLFGTLGVILLWSAINVTNCTDGVDGLLGTLSLVTLGSFYLAGQRLGGVARIAFGIYLVHDLFIMILRSLGVTTLSFAPVASVPALTAVVFLCAFGVAWLFSKIPFLGRWLT